MSYNIDTWKTKELLNLKVPIKSFFKSERKDFHPTKKIENGKIILDFGEDKIIGTKVDNSIIIEKISFSGECSGIYYHKILLPAFDRNFDCCNCLGRRRLHCSFGMQRWRHQRNSS